MRRKRLEHPSDLGVEPSYEGLLLVDPSHKCSHSHNWCLVTAGKSRMTLSDLRNELRRASALLVNGDHGALFAYSGHGRVDHRAALVDYPLKGDVVVLKVVVRDKSAVAAVLLVVGGEDIHVYGQLEAFRDKLLDC